MYISNVNTDGSENKCHDASQIHFQIIQNLAQVTSYSSFSVFSFAIKFYYFEIPQKNLYPCD